MRVEETRGFEVQVGDGYKVPGKGICRELEVDFQGCKMKQDFHPFALGNVDVILGMVWLYTVDNTNTSWRRLTLAFEWEGKHVVIKGDPALQTTTVSARTMIRTIQNEGVGFVVELSEIQKGIRRSALPLRLKI